MSLCLLLFQNRLKMLKFMSIFLPNPNFLQAGEVSGLEFSKDKNLLIKKHINNRR